MKKIYFLFSLLYCFQVAQAQNAGLSLQWNGSAYVVKMEVTTGANPLLLGSSQVSIVTPAAVTTAGFTVTCVTPCSVGGWSANAFVNAPPAAPGNNFVAIATFGGNMGNMVNGSSVTLFTFTLPGGCNQNVRLFINGTDPNSAQMPGGQDFSNTLVNGLTAFEFYNGTNLNDVICVPAPLDLLHFAARLDGDNVLLNWVTQNERDMHHFDVQRSADGINFENIGQQRAVNTAFAVYDWLDERLPAGIQVLYYRLLQVSLDNSGSTSPVRQIRVRIDQFRLSAAPVPAHSVMTVTIGSPDETTAAVVVSDATLRTLYNGRHAINKGATTIEISVSNWPAGTYLLSVKSGDRSAQMSIVVSH